VPIDRSTERSIGRRPQNSGLLDSTIVHWGGEIGRLPVSEGNFDSQVGAITTAKA